MTHSVCVDVDEKYQRTFSYSILMAMNFQFQGVIHTYLIVYICSITKGWGNEKWNGIDFKNRFFLLLKKFFCVFFLCDKCSGGNLLPSAFLLCLFELIILVWFLFEKEWDEIWRYRRGGIILRLNKKSILNEISTLKDCLSQKNCLLVRC